MTWLVVLLRIFANPFSNVFQKSLTRKAADPLFVIFVTHALLSVVCAPMCLIWFRGLSAEFWVNISICAVLAVAGNAMIVQAVKLADLSVLGPVNAYKAVVSLVPGMILLREMPAMGGLAGIILIVGGSYFLVEKGEREGGGLARLFGDRGVQYRLLALVFSAIEAVFLKKAILASSPLVTFVFWAVLGFAVSLAAAAALIGRDLGHEVVALRAGMGEYLLLFLTTGIMQFCTLVSFKTLHVGYALALFQTSSIVGVILGHRFFQERHIMKRLVGSSIMVVGASLIIWSR